MNPYLGFLLDIGNNPFVFVGLFTSVSIVDVLNLQVVGLHTSLLGLLVAVGKDGVGWGSLSTWANISLEIFENIFIRMSMLIPSAKVMCASLFRLFF